VQKVIPFFESGSCTNQIKEKRNKKMEIELRYSIPIDDSNGNFLVWSGDEEIDKSVVHNVELNADGSVYIDLGASNRPCSISLDPALVASITLQTSPKVGERMKRGLLTKAIRVCGMMLFFFFRLHDTPHVRVFDPSRGELLMES
jgi:hypothetical protein